MKYLGYVSTTLFLYLTASISYADGDRNIYTWKSANGTTVFSQVAPMFDEEYERVGVDAHNEVHQKSPVEQQLAFLKQNSLHIDEPKPLAEKSSSRVNYGIVNVRIISPASGEMRFVHNEKLPIILDPILDAEDFPIFILNGISYPAHYQGGAWLVNRPNPGPVTITVRGRTKDHKTITSGESEFHRRQVLGRA